MSGGRPKNKEIIPTEPELVNLMEHLDQAVFSQKKSSKEKAHFLSNLYALHKKHPDDRLAESELKNKFFNLYENKQPLRLSKEFVGKLCYLLIKLKSKEFVIDVEIIDAFRKKYAATAASEIKDENRESEILQLLFKNKPQLEHLADTEWAFFERTGDEDIKGANWGIAIGKMTFCFSKNYLHVKLNTVYKTLQRTYSGIATQDAKNCFFIDLLKVEDNGKKNTRSNIVLQLADSDAPRQIVMIGHYTFYSPSNAYDHILSKTVVLLKLSPEVQQLGNTKEGDYNHSSDGFKAIAQDIKSFLYRREMNRMSMPKEAISDLVELKGFLENHRYSKLNPILKKHFLGTYYVYYKRLDEIIVEDTLLIEINENAIKILALYTHQPDADKKHTKKWLGQAYVNNSKSGISIELSNEKSVERGEQEDPILLTFWIPDLSVTYGESQCYPGVIAGLEDSSDRPISFNCLVVKQSVANFDRVNDSRLINYFNKQGLSMIKPNTANFKLDSLN